MLRTIPSGAAELACETAGDGPPVILLHPGVGDRRVWAGVSAALEGVRTVAYDRRGFGDTRYRAESFSHVDDLGAVLDAVAPGESVVLVGSSQGGRVAIDFTLAHPARVRGLVLVAPAVSGEEWPEVLPAPLPALAAAIEAAEEAGDIEALNRLEAQLWLDGPGSSEGRVGGDARALFLDMNRRALTASSPGEEREPPSALDRLGEITAPTLVGAGALDVSLVTERAEMIARAIPRAQLVTFESAAHLPQLEAPARFAAELRRFLAGLPAPGAA